MKLDDIDALAVTVEPGLPLSLIIGRDFVLHLSRIADKPVIPVHHMKAHALTARMIEKVITNGLLEICIHTLTFPIMLKKYSKLLHR